VKGGVKIASLTEGGAAEKAGLKVGDIIVEFAGVAIRETPDLQRRVASVTPGKPTDVTVLREGQRTSLRVTIGEMPSDEPIASATPDEGWGLRVEAVGADLAQRLPTQSSAGALIVDVFAGSPAEAAGLRRGDIVLELDGRPVDTPAALVRELAQVKPGGTVRLYVHRPGAEGVRHFVMLERREREP
jgi:serine protease Do